MSDGNVHMEQIHASCGLPGERSANEAAASMVEGRALNQGHCRDISLERDTTDHCHRNLIQLPSLAMIPLGSPITLTQTETPSFRNTPAVTPPTQLVSLQSVVLLI